MRCRARSRGPCDGLELSPCSRLREHSTLKYIDEASAHFSLSGIIRLRYSQ